MGGRRGTSQAPRDDASASGSATFVFEQTAAAVDDLQLRRSSSAPPPLASDAASPPPEMRTPTHQVQSTPTLHSAREDRRGVSKYARNGYSGPNVQRSNPAS